MSDCYEAHDEFYGDDFESCERRPATNAEVEHLHVVHGCTCDPDVSVEVTRDAIIPGLVVAIRRELIVWHDPDCTAYLASRAEFN